MGLSTPQLRKAWKEFECAKEKMTPLGCVDKEDSQISFALIQGSFGGSCHDPRFVERQGVGLS